MKKLSFTIVALLILATNLFAKDVMDGKKMSDPIPNDPTVLTGTFENGLTYYIKENRHPENRADLQMMIRSGSINEEDTQWGLAHFIEHMCFNGTKNFPKNELVSYFESIGMQFGGDVNAYTSYDRTVYTIQVPMDDKKIVDNGVQILEDWLHNVSFDPEELEKERGVIIEEWRVRSGAMGRYQSEMISTLAADSRWAIRNVIGDTNVILTAPRERFTSYYNDWYRPNNAAVIAVGDFNKDEMFKIIEKKFASIKNPKNERPNFSNDVPEFKGYKTSYFVDKEWPYPTMIGVTMNKPKKFSVTYQDYRDGLVQSLVSQMFSSRFIEYTQEETCPLVQGGGTISGSIANWDAFSLNGFSKEGQMKEAYQFLLNEMFRAKQHGFQSGELKRAKENMKTMIEKVYNERDKNESGNYAREYLAHFDDKTFYPGIAIEKQLHDKWLSEITLAESNKLMADAIDLDNAIFSVATVEKEGGENPKEMDMKAMFLASSKKSYEPYEDVEINEPLMAKIPAPGKVVKEEKIADIDAVKWTLSNGAEVYLKKTDFKNDEISFKSYAMGGTSLAPTENLENAQNAASIVAECGLGKFDQSQLTKLLTGKRVSVYPNIGTYSYGLSGRSTNKDVETMFQMLNMHFTAPRTDEKAFNVYKKNSLDGFEAAKADPNTVVSNAATLTMYGNNPRRQPDSRESIESMNLEKAYSFYQEMFDGVGGFKFVFVGSLDMDLMKKYVETYIASLPKGKVKNYKDNNVRVVRGQKTEKVYSGMDHKSKIYQIRNNKFDYTYDNTFETSALSKLLSIRLREEIREDEGGTYGVGAYISTSYLPEASYNFVVTFSTKPERVEELLTKANNVVKEIAKGNFEEENVSKIKKQLKRRRETDLKKNRFWLGQIYSKLYYKQPFSIINEHDKYIEKIDKDYLVKAAKKYTGDKNDIKIIQMPEAMGK